MRGREPSASGWGLRVQLGALALGLGAGGLLALTLRFEHWRGSAVLTLERYELAFSGHALAMLAALACSWLLLGRLVSESMPRQDAPPPLRGERLLALLGVVAVAYIGVGEGLSAAAQVSGAAAAMSLPLLCGVTGMRWGAPLTVTAAAFALTGIGALAPDGPLSAWTQLVGLGLTAAASLRTARAATSRDSPPGRLLALAIAPALAVLAGAPVLIDRALDFPAAQTYLYVGTLHMSGTLTHLVVLLGLWGRWEYWTGRAVSGSWAGAGALSLGAGATVTAGAMLRLGAEGMPRRFQKYLPEFQWLHQLVGTATLAMVIGGCCAVVAMLVGPRPGARD